MTTIYTGFARRLAERKLGLSLTVARAPLYYFLCDDDFLFPYGLQITGDWERLGSFSWSGSSCPPGLFSLCDMVMN